MTTAFTLGRLLRHGRFILAVAGLLLALAGPLAAAEAEPAQAITYPGLEEFIPRLTAVAARAVDAEQQIASAAKALELAPKIDALQKSLDKLEQQFSSWEQVNEWPLSTLMEARSRYAELQTQQSSLQEGFSTPLKDLETIHQSWTNEQAYWEGWGQTLRDTWQKAQKAARVKAPRESFERTLATIQGVIAKNTVVTNQVIKLQLTFSSQQELVAGRIKRIDVAMADLRKDTFRRNAPAVFAPEFYAQYTAALLTELQGNIATTLRVPGDFFKRHGWVAILQVLVGLIVVTLLKLRRKKPKPITMELRFLFDHPWAGAVVAASTLFTGLYTSPPALWRWALIVFTFTAATFLIVAMYRKLVIRRLIRLTAVILILSETLQLIGLPRPLQQVYLIALCLVITFTSLTLAQREGRDVEAHRSGLTMLLYLSTAIGLIGLAAGVIGFVTFTTNLVDAFLGTIMVVLGTNMAVRLADGSVYAFMKKDWVREQKFVQRLGIQTTARLQTLMHVVLYANAGVSLFVVWNIYETASVAWTSLLSLEYTIGDFTLSLHMVVLLALVLYLTNLASWVLQALLDAQFLTPRGMAYGVRSAFKRLLHYALFTIGFFIAISMAGIGLEKFAIIAGALGVGIGFGLQNIVNNFISGLILLFERPIKLGDVISLDNQWGTVTKIGLRSTVVEDFDRAEVIVPNADLISQKVINWTLTSNISRLILPVGVAYGSNLTRVLSILDTVGKEHPAVLSDPAPNAIFTGFGESSIDFELRVWIDDINKRLQVKSDLGQAVDSRFKDAGIAIPFPQRDLHLRSIEGDLQELLGGTRSKPPLAAEGHSE